MKTVMSILLIVSSLVLIATVLLQSGKSAGMSGAISGGAEAIWGKKQGRSYEAILEKLTAVSAIVFLLSALVLAALK